MKLYNDKVSLRALEPIDLELLYSWENNTEIWCLSNTFTPFSKYTLMKYIEESGEDIYKTKQLRLIIENIKTKKAVGAIDLFDIDFHNQRAGVGILINNLKDRQKGMASASLDILINYSFAKLGLHQLYCNIDSENIDSLNLFKKKGFKVIGIKKDWIKVLNIWRDELLLQKINSSFQNLSH